MTTSRTSRVFNGLLFLLLIIFATNAKSESVDTRILNEILSYMNETIPACDDYYGYACGKWAEVHENDNYIEITGKIDHAVNQNLVLLMNELAQRSVNQLSAVESKVLKFYQSCRQTKTSSLNSKNYLRLVPPNDQIPWPQFNAKSHPWGRQKFQWMETLARLRRYGMSNVFFKLDVNQDIFNSSKYIIDIDVPSFQEKNERLQSSTMTKLMLRLMGVERRKAFSLSGKVKNLELSVRTLAERLSEGDSVDVTLRRLDQRTRGKWRNYVNIVCNQTVPSNYKVQVDNMDYLVGLIELLQHEDPEVIATYIMLRFASHVIEEAMDIDDEISCIQDVRRNMELAVSLLYEQRFISADKMRQHEDDLHQLFEQLRKQFLLELDGNRLRLTRNQLRHLQTKATRMWIKFGNMPQDVNRTKFVEEFYADLKFSDGDNYAQCHLKLLEFRTSRWFGQLHKSALSATSYFLMTDSDTAMSSTPYYLLRQNLIIVPYGIMQEPIFHREAHDVFKMSLLGFMLAHELMHGFVTGGIHFDFQGNGYELGAGIMEKRLYKVAEDCMNSNETAYLDEREADITGIRLAYDAYFADDSPFNRTQPEFTSRPLIQLFFLNLAQFFCGDGTSSEFVDHDTDELRLRQVMINFPAFAQAHNCRQDVDQMHPAKKCRMW
ncbi:membrane metallo-endopeptidase-like 1 [Drosophila sulfurigaster albostrigata]|uniref:membrane metallo-endopeptidase-like 1 n=1 Tax=Drosophila sulfurigaster albostrigata TaxID=89887 RepID=UPI002D21BB60|nr:membrane metallo-endopeptidase-like 1 [Drosophila sulfurigaster albostrigata]